jgi:hypothetical protein
MFTKFQTPGCCAETFIHFYKRAGIKVELFEPDLQREIRFKVTAPSRERFYAVYDMVIDLFTIKVNPNSLTEAQRANQAAMDAERLRNRNKGQRR